VQYLRTPALLTLFVQARAQGTYDRLLKRFGKIALLIIDDFGLASLTEQQKQDLLEIIEERYGTGATIITSQPFADSLMGCPPARVYPDPRPKHMLASKVCIQFLLYYYKSANCARRFELGLGRRILRQIVAKG
jgi:hypothetical protein